MLAEVAERDAFVEQVACVDLRDEHLPAVPGRHDPRAAVDGEADVVGRR